MALIKVKSKSDTGFRRAGRLFTKDFCPPFEADAKTLALLEDEKSLVVEKVAAGKTPPPGGTEDKDKKPTTAAEKKAQR